VRSCQAAGRRADVPLDALRIGHVDGDLYGPRCAWVRHRQIASDGAILVRPDRFIAWLCPAGSGQPQAALAAALSQILAQPVGTPTAAAA
jgi:2,4-dichlorophenol 6-monooxygenase